MTLIVTVRSLLHVHTNLITLSLDSDFCKEKQYKFG